jgi:alpha-L-fucosidase 2
MARRDFEVEMFWKKGKLTKALITSKAGGLCQLRTNEKISVASTKTNQISTRLDNLTQYLTTFTTTQGKSYEIKQGF